MISLLAAVLLSAAPRVSAVVVYPDRAQVSRTAEVACGGVSKVAFDRIPPAADPESLRAKVKGGALEGLTTVEVPVESAFGAEREAQDKKVRDLRFEVKKLEDQQAQAVERAALADRFAEVAASQVGSEMAEPKPNTKAWAAAFDTALDAKLTSAAELAKVQAALEQARERLGEAVARFEQLSAAAPRVERRAEALVRCDKGTAAVELTYVVGGSSWTPAYEARSNEAGGSVELATYATVQQATGEDWDKAAVTLSTALPSDDATVPEIHALRVYTYERNVDKKVLVRRDEVRDKAEAASGEDGKKAPSMRVVPQGISVQLEVPGASTVPGDGTAVRLLVGRTQLKASFFSRAVPKLVPAVFRVADVVNTAPYPLLAGMVDAYGKGGFIGRYALERVPQGAPFHLTFGLQEELRAKRIVKEELKKQEGLFGQRNRFRYVYVFELGNYRSKAETIELTEHVPVSELDDVSVEVEKDKTTAGYEMKPEDGLARWKIQLAPGEKKQVDLAFHVDVPTSYESGGL